MRHPTHLPTNGEVFLDARGAGRALRVSWHPEADIVVLSVWHAGTCAGSFRLPVDEVSALIDVLQSSLAAAYDARGRSLRHATAR
jgi:hypothetical protein